MSKTYWLAEYREGGKTVGYLMDLKRGDGGFDAYMTREPAKAMRFDSASSAQIIIDDSAFQRTVPRADQFFVEEHMDCEGPTHAEIDATTTPFIERIDHGNG